MLRDFRSAASIAQACGDAVGHAQTVQEHVNEAIKFLQAQSGAAPAVDQDVAQRTWYRKKTLEVGIHLQHQMTITYGHGFEKMAIHKSKIDDVNNNAYEWYGAAYAMDRGADNCCLENFLRYGPAPDGDVVYNFQARWDLSHDGKATVKNSIADGGMAENEYVALLACKAAGGPWGEGTRRSSWRSAVFDHLMTHTPATSPWFMYCLPFSLEEQDRLDELNEPNIAEKVWEEWKTDNDFYDIGSDYNQERFMCCVYHARSEARGTRDTAMVCLT